MDAIALFHEQDTRDELGLGAVRDGFADLFFPGTSTIQTRARYFLFIPWVYLDLERKEVASAGMTGRARAAEIRLIDVLATSEDADGTIGIDARASLKRLPSNIYWQGLGDWGIRLFQGSQEQYQRAADGFYTQRKRAQRTDDGEPADGAVARNWHAALPDPPADFPRTASFGLRRREAEYLQERLMTTGPRSLFAFLLDRGRPTGWVDFAWQHPQLGEFPAAIRDQLDHARRFSEIIHGSALLYNLMLAEAAKNERREAEYREDLGEWSERVAQQADALARWDMPRFWILAGQARGPIGPGTQDFVEGWIARTRSAPSIVGDREARRLIQDREARLKRSQARLTNPRALERWSGAAGTAQLNYRWGIAQRIIADIHAGLGWATGA